jgi:hypothetical protein
MCETLLIAFVYTTALAAAQGLAIILHVCASGRADMSADEYLKHIAIADRPEVCEACAQTQSLCIFQTSEHGIM